MQSSERNFDELRKEWDKGKTNTNQLNINKMEKKPKI